MGKKNSSKRSATTKTKGKDNNDDWIAALARKSATQESAASLPSKAERIERRNAKKRRRQDRKPLSMNAPSKTKNEQECERTHKRMNGMSEACIQSLARTLERRVMSLQDMSSSRTRPFQSDVVKKGKATAGNRLTDEMIQPRRRDYGGLGLARPSMYISLRDPSFVPKLEEEFGEHVPGFFGKQKTKAMKKQLDGNMLWRQLAEKRTDDRKLGGKKLSDMTPAERVEAMIKAGMI